jgi:hypothetical protein
MRKAGQGGLSTLLACDSSSDTAYNRPEASPVRLGRGEYRLYQPQIRHRST